MAKAIKSIKQIDIDYETFKKNYQLSDGTIDNLAELLNVSASELQEYLDREENLNLKRILDLTEEKATITAFANILKVASTNVDDAKNIQEKSLIINTGKWVLETRAKKLFNKKADIEEPKTAREFYEEALISGSISDKKVNRIAKETHEMVQKALEDLKIIETENKLSNYDLSLITNEEPIDLF